jgi:cytochrome c oxidase subunit 2
MTDTPASARDALRAELRWAAIVGVAVGIIVVAVIFAAVVFGINPPSNIEHIDPKTLHLSDEFTESNLGTRVDANGQVTVRVVTTQFSFIPSCVVVPADRPVTLRFASPDVIHGILVTGTNVNTMVVPGYVAQVHTEFTETGDLLMPCQEYCGVGHSQMIATVHVVPASQFSPDAEGKVSCEPLR